MPVRDAEHVAPEVLGEDRDVYPPGSETEGHAADRSKPAQARSRVDQVGERRGGQGPEGKPADPGQNAEYKSLDRPVRDEEETRDDEKNRFAVGERVDVCGGAEREEEESKSPDSPVERALEDDPDRDEGEDEEDVRDGRSHDLDR